MIGIGIDEFKGKPDGTMTATERLRFIGFDFTRPIGSPSVFAPGLLGFGIDDFAGKPDGGMTARERMRFVNVDTTIPKATAPIVIAAQRRGQHTRVKILNGPI